MFMYESATISLTFFSNMAAYPGDFEDEGDEDSCISCLDTTKYRCLRCKFPLWNKFSLPSENDEIPGWKAGKFVAYCVPCSKEAFEQNTQYSTHAVGGENAVSGLKAPFSLFRWRKNVLYFDPARAYYICMNHYC